MLSKIPLSLQIVLAMLLALVVGPFMGASWGVTLGEIGKYVIILLKTIATPLLFFTILVHVLTAEVNWKGGVRLVFFALLNGFIALALALTLSNVFRPGRFLPVHEMQGLKSEVGSLKAIQPVKALDPSQFLAGLIPSNVVQPFLDNAVLMIVVLALFFGLGLRAVRDRKDSDAEVRTAVKSLQAVFLALQQTTVQILAWVIRLTPLAVFAVVAKSISESGFVAMKGLGAYLLVGVVGLSLPLLIVYPLWIRFFAKIRLRDFFQEAKEPMLYGLGANSSLATLPLTLKALDRLKISKSASALGVCVGTNINQDGILLYEALAALFIAQAYGIDLSFAQQVSVSIACLFAAMGVAGIPEAGFISLAVVLGTVGLPVEVLPLLLTVDWILARMRTVVNVASDLTLSIILHRMEKIRP
ncbi:MAG: dicarboxylate/amino acid:cation symporter [Bdellovibrionales bacterium]|nr:dicarboxylate/amino acid:cation symporter [Bdellovibrionales bacterium]